MKIATIEHHDGALAIWRDAGVRQRTLLHIDAHSDLYDQWEPSAKRGPRPRINAANFIYPAIESGLVSSVLWVVPDASWTVEGRRDIARILRRCDAGAGRTQVIAQTDTSMRALALGCEVQVCTLAHLPPLAQPVILDIDVDYCVIPSVGARRIGVYGRMPWIWPEELCRALDQRGVRSDLATIAYSVEGGYTPLQWKFLGDELALRLSGASGEHLRWADDMRHGAEAADAGDYTVAAQCYRRVIDGGTNCAPAYFHLAHLSAAQGRADTAQLHWHAAIGADASYRTRDNTSGWWYVEHDRFAQARAAFERVHQCDPCDASAMVGLSIIAMRDGRETAAEQGLRAATAHDADDVDSWRYLGQLLARRGQPGEAVAALERSLRLGLSGRRPRHQGNLGETDGGAWDPQHRRVMHQLAGLYASMRRWPQALAAARMVVASDGATPTEWARVAWIAGESGRWSLAVSASRSALAAVPEGCRQSFRRIRVAAQRRAARRRAAVADAELPASPRMWI